MSNNTNNTTAYKSFPVEQTFFATPDDFQTFIAQTKSYSNSERTAALVCGMMGYNLAAKDSQEVVHQIVIRLSEILGSLPPNSHEQQVDSDVVCENIINLIDNIIEGNII